MDFGRLCQPGRHPLFVAFAAAALLAAAPDASYSTIAYLAHLTAFTLWQAFLSTALSVVFAVPVALALARRRLDFPGRGLVAALLVLPLGLPFCRRCSA